MPRCDCQSRFQAVKAPAGVPRDVAGAIIGRLDQNQMTFCAHPLGRTVIHRAPGGSDAALRKRTAAARATVSSRRRNGAGRGSPGPLLLPLPDDDLDGDRQCHRDSRQKRAMVKHCVPPSIGPSRYPVTRSDAGQVSLAGVRVLAGKHSVLIGNHRLARGRGGTEAGRRSPRRLTQPRTRPFYAPCTSGGRRCGAQGCSSIG